MFPKDDPAKRKRGGWRSPEPCARSVVDVPEPPRKKPRVPTRSERTIVSVDLVKTQLVVQSGRRVDWKIKEGRATRCANCESGKNATWNHFYNWRKAPPAQAPSCSECPLRFCYSCFYRANGENVISSRHFGDAWHSKCGCFREECERSYLLCPACFLRKAELFSVRVAECPLCYPPGPGRMYGPLRCCRLGHACWIFPRYLLLVRLALSGYEGLISDVAMCVVEAMIKVNGGRVAQKKAEDFDQPFYLRGPIEWYEINSDGEIISSDGE